MLFSKTFSIATVLTKICQKSKLVPNFHQTLLIRVEKHCSAKNLASKSDHRKILKLEIDQDKKLKQVNAFCTAEAYNLQDLSIDLEKKGIFQEVEIDEQVEFNVAPFQSKTQTESDKKEIFFFKEGSFVCWNFTEQEINSILNFIKAYEIKPYETKPVLEEREQINFVLDDNAKSKFSKGLIHLGKEENLILKQYTFSHAISLSVKLAMWETALDKYVESIKFITEDMKAGKRINLTRHEVFKKTGDLFALRHHINLSSDLLDVPDFYWDRDDLEHLFQITFNFLNMSKRTKVMNEKLNHCTELIDLISNHLNEKHHVRLEWMIIILIMVEVGFEAIHYADFIKELII